MSLTANFNVHLHLEAKVKVNGAAPTLLHVTSWVGQFKYTVISNPL